MPVINGRLRCWKQPDAPPDNRIEVPRPEGFVPVSLSGIRHRKNKGLLAMAEARRRRLESLRKQQLEIEQRRALRDHPAPPKKRKERRNRLCGLAPETKRPADNFQQAYAEIQRKFGAKKYKTKRALADAMRRCPTPSEAKLEQALIALRPQWQFRRSVALYGYIADFYCREANLVLELDGKWHKGRKQYDSERDAHLLEAGIRTMRFPSARAYHKPERIVEEVRRELEEISRVGRLSKRLETCGDGASAKLTSGAEIDGWAAIP